MRHRLLSSTLCVLLLGLAAGCGAPQPRATATATTTATTRPTATLPPGPPTPLNVPTGWQVFAFGHHFTIAYPSDWTYLASPPPTGLMGQTIILTDPAGAPATGQVSVSEWYGFSQSDLQTFCQHQNTTTVTLAGLPVQYMVIEGVHRNWQFVNSNGVEYVLNAFDANQPQDVQQRHDAVLATFRPDDATSGCAAA